MVPINLQLELIDHRLTIPVEQLGQLPDDEVFMCYQIKAFNNRSVVCVNIENDLLTSEEVISYSEDDVFSTEEIKAIATAVREYNSSRKLNFDQMYFDF